jgi:phosphate transport system substrate-binding protein
MLLRRYDVTEGDTPDTHSAHSFEEYECSEQDSDIHVPLPAHNRSYVAELGYITDTGHWLKLARSAAVQVPNFSKEATSVESVDVAPTSANSTIEKTTVARVPTARIQHYGDFTPGDAATVQHYGDFTPGDAATVQRYGKSNVEKSSEDDGAGKFDAMTTSLLKGQSLKSSERSAGDRAVQNNRIILVPRSAKNAYVYWEISPADRELIKQQGGIKPILKVYEVTNIDRDEIAAHSMQQFECDEPQQDCSVAIPIGDRDYVAEIGYTTIEGYWLSIIRSLHVRVPAI